MCDTDYYNPDFHGYHVDKGYSGYNGYGYKKGEKGMKGLYCFLNFFLYSLTHESEVTK